MRRSSRRGGYTLLELVAVMAILLILGAVALPSLFAVHGNVRQKAGADLVRARLADARAWAMQFDRPYRMQVHEDSTRVRVSPDGMPNPAQSADASAAPDRTREDALDRVTATLEPDDETAPVVDPDGWVTVMTFLPNGTCRENKAVVAVHENGFPPLRVRVRGVTGSVRMLPQTPEAQP